MTYRPWKWKSSMSNILLQDAMSIRAPSEKVKWYVTGCPVKIDYPLPYDPRVANSTFVEKEPEGDYEVGLFWFQPRKRFIIDSFSSLRALQHKYPILFKLQGELDIYEKETSDMTETPFRNPTRETDVEDKQLKQIAELMSQKLKKNRLINPIKATDVVKVPDNYQLENRRKAVYVACVDRTMVIATVWNNGKITIAVCRQKFW